MKVVLESLIDRKEHAPSFFDVAVIRYSVLHAEEVVDCGLLTLLDRPNVAPLVAVSCLLISLFVAPLLSSLLAKQKILDNLVAFSQSRNETLRGISQYGILKYTVHTSVLPSPGPSIQSLL